MGGVWRKATARRQPHFSDSGKSLPPRFKRWVGASLRLGGAPSQRAASSPQKDGNCGMACKLQ